MPRPRYAKDPVVDRSLHHSVREAVAYSTMAGAGETYFSAFALHLKASTAQIGVLASLPLLLGSLFQLVSAWWGHRSGRRRPIILLGAYAQAAVWVPLTVLPLLFPDLAVPLLIGCVVLYQAAANLIAPQWSSLMGDLVPERRRGRYFARRTRLATATSFTALVLGGGMLHAFDVRGAALAGYVSLFAIAALARLVSAYHLGRMHDPPGKVAALELPTRADWRQRLRRSPFARFSIYFALMQWAVAIASPFFVVYTLRDLQWSYLQFTAITGTSVLAQFLTLQMWGRIGDAFGNRLVLSLTGFLIPLMPALWLVSTEFWYLILIQALSGFTWAGFSLSAANFLYDLVPAGKRATYLAAHNVLASFAVFAGAVLGGQLGAVMPREIHLAGLAWEWPSALFGVFIVSAAARFAVAAAFVPRLREVRPVRPMSVHGLIFRVTRFNALAGLVYQVIGARSPQEAREDEEKARPS